MKNWINKTFRKRKVNRVLYDIGDNRIVEYWVIPKNGVLDCGDFVFNINSNVMKLTYKNIPTYIYPHKSADAIDLGTGKPSFKTPDEYKTIIKSNEIIKVYNAANPFLLSTDTIVIIMAVVLSALALGYFITGKLDMIIGLLQPVE